MSNDCSHDNIISSRHITDEGVLHRIVECVDCGKEEIELFTDKYPEAVNIALRRPLLLYNRFVGSYNIRKGKY